MDGLQTVSERTGEYMNPVASELQHLRTPEMIPEGVVVCGRIACVESGLNELPVLVPANAFGQGSRVEVWVAVSEGSLRRVEQILTVKEDDRPFRGWFGSHRLGPRNWRKRITPPG